MITITNPDNNQSYFIFNQIDAGGFGTVHDAFSSDFKAVAVKLIRPTNSFMKDFATWTRERLAQLLFPSHPNIVSVLDSFWDGTQFVIVMEKATGCLHTLIDGTPLQPEAVYTVGIQVLNALDHIHGLDVIHRDVTTKNILLFADGSVKLSDFGIARQNIGVKDVVTTATAHPSFVPPELFKFGYTSHQSDIYQLGLVLLASLQGGYCIPLTMNRRDTETQVRDGVPRKEAEKLIPVHGKLAEMLAKMLRRRDEYRYSSAAEALAEFRDALDLHLKVKELLESLQSPPPSQFPWKKPRTRK